MLLQGIIDMIYIYNSLAAYCFILNILSAIYLIQPNHSRTNQLVKIYKIILQILWFTFKLLDGDITTTCVWPISMKLLVT